MHALTKQMLNRAITETEKLLDYPAIIRRPAAALVKKLIDSRFSGLETALDNTDAFSTLTWTMMDVISPRAGEALGREWVKAAHKMASNEDTHPRAMFFASEVAGHHSPQLKLGALTVIAEHAGAYKTGGAYCKTPLTILRAAWAAETLPESTDRKRILSKLAEKWQKVMPPEMPSEIPPEHQVCINLENLAKGAVTPALARTSVAMIIELGPKAPPFAAQHAYEAALNAKSLTPQDAQKIIPLWESSVRRQGDSALEGVRQARAGKTLPAWLHAPADRIMADQAERAQANRPKPRQEGLPFLPKPTAERAAKVALAG